MPAMGAVEAPPLEEMLVRVLKEEAVVNDRSRLHNEDSLNVVDTPFSLDAIIEGATVSGHRIMALTTATADVRCRACGQRIAYMIIEAADTTDPRYVFAPAGLDACPMAFDQQVG